MSVREEEKEEIEAFIQKVPIPVKESPDNPIAKTIILLQCHIAALPLAGSTLLADTVYVTQSASRSAAFNFALFSFALRRLLRALFELSLRKRWAALSERALTLCKAGICELFLFCIICF
jgi:pre-mRNA-splicing helicase BRR2